MEKIQLHLQIMYNMLLNMSSHISKKNSTRLPLLLLKQWEENHMEEFTGIVAGRMLLTDNSLPLFVHLYNSVSTSSFKDLQEEQFAQRCRILAINVAQLMSRLELKLDLDAPYRSPSLVTRKRFFEDKEQQRRKEYFSQN